MLKLTKVLIGSGRSKNFYLLAALGKKDNAVLTIRTIMGLRIWFMGFWVIEGQNFILVRILIKLLQWQLLRRWIIITGVGQFQVISQVPCLIKIPLSARMRNKFYVIPLIIDFSFH